MFSRKMRRESKAKLEHKLYLAKETPEPIFDLSDCDIKEVPQGIYSLCRVFLKERLSLESNCLSSLSGGGILSELRFLKILNISHNNFITLPESIGTLTSLQEFYASHNSLKELPGSLCDLENLQILDVSHNKLKQLPDDIGILQYLKKLNLVNNHLKQLPASICQAQRLVCLNLDPEHFEYPPEEVVKRGLEAIVQYLCEDIGVEYKKRENLSEVLLNVEKSVSNFEEDDKSWQAKIWELETIKQKKIRQFLEIEKHNDLLQRQELELANAQRLNREKLLHDIAKEQDEFDSKLYKIQQLKEQDKFRLIEQLHEAEQNAYMAIGQLLAINREPLTAIMEYEKQEEEKLLAAANAHNEDLKRTEIVEAMRILLEEEGIQFENIYQQRVEMSKSILQREVEWNNKISELMNMHDSSKKEIASKLMSDMELQKAALGTLLERNDSRSWGILQQVSLVESQLAALTQIELDRRKLHLDEQVKDFAEKRMELSALLMDLLVQQDIRRSEILDTLKTLEDNWDKKSQDYWLNQYQALLNRIPEGIAKCQKNIDPLLAEALLMNGVIHCLPHLAKIMQNDYELEYVDEKTLVEAGVSSKQERLNILDAFTFYNKQKQYGKKKGEKEVPETTDTGQGPSAPPLDHFEYVGGSMNECVVCMDKECQVIFVPCGHIVCCLACSAVINLCPFCRLDIERKIRIIL
ncbi:E3 ubiquitin-protein ligase LRSAM1-like isoform X1 [Harmonia axyridis]|uniref:E3 ubiquitin-protein ligase LRSAM1-like isoform X1 n=1 Tax=Harmonia axyridis TaxID=115357 RepID=UPI001E2781D3|nr:E3 ubiquitin-protein ligase LRSAM1-like isoform X1 [Harmonia axyridis]